MSEAQEKRGATGTIALAVAALLVALLILYVLSSGPVTGLYSRNYISRGAYDAFHAPLDWAGARFSPLQRFVYWYDCLFERDPFEPA